MASASWRAVMAPVLRLITWHGNDFTSRFPFVVAAVRALQKTDAAPISEFGAALLGPQAIKSKNDPS
jgi:hypothetical protein